MYSTPKFTKPMRLMLAMVGLSLLLTAGLGASVSAAPVDAPAAELHVEMHDETGVLILSVVPDSPADEAGITRGDIVLAVGDEAIDSVETFAGAIGALAAGDEIVITVLHGDDTLDLPAILGQRDGRTYLGVVPHAEEAMSADEADTDEADADDVDVDDVTEDAVEDEAADEDASDEASTEDAGADDTKKDTEEDEVPAERHSLRSMIPFGQGGAMIAEVVEDGPAAEAGLVAGDLIVAVDGEELSEDVDFAELIGAHGPGDEVTLTVTNIEANETLEVPVTLGAHPDDEERAFLGIAYMLAPTFPAMGDAAPDEDADSDDTDLDNDEAMEESEEGDEDAAPTARRSRHSMMPFGQGGAMIVEVAEDGPADEAGLVAGDLIVTVDGQELGDDVDFAELIGSYAPGDEVTLTVTNIESNETMEMPVVLGAHPEDEGIAFLGIAYVLAPALPGMDDVAPDTGDEDADGEDAGMSEDDDSDLDEDEASEESDETDEGSVPDSRYGRSGMASIQGGAKVAEVVAGGAAAEAGLVAGDLIVAVDGEKLSAEATLGDLIGGYAPGDEVVLTIQNRGSDETVDVTVTLDAHPDDAERAYLGVAYMPVLNRAGDSRYRRQNADPAPRQRQKPQDEASQDEGSQDEELEDGDGCIHGHEGYHGGEEHHGAGEHGGMMMPFFHHGMEGHGMGGHGMEDFDFDQLSEEDREALEEMYPFLFPDVESEGETEGENG